MQVDYVMLYKVLRPLSLTTHQDVSTGSFPDSYKGLLDFGSPRLVLPNVSTAQDSSAAAGENTGAPVCLHRRPCLREA